MDWLVILYWSRISYPRRSGLVRKSNHLRPIYLNLKSFLSIILFHSIGPCLAFRLHSDLDLHGGNYKPLNTRWVVDCIIYFSRQGCLKEQLWQNATLISKSFEANAIKFRTPCDLDMAYGKQDANDLDCTLFWIMLSFAFVSTVWAQCLILELQVLLSFQQLLNTNLKVMSHSWRLLHGYEGKPNVIDNREIIVQQDWALSVH